MIINAVAVISSNLTKTIEFYKTLGFEFPDELTEGHVEAITKDGSARLMIDSVETIKSIYGHEPKPSNHSNFAIFFDSALLLNEAVEKLSKNNFTIYKEPWDAFWGQRYAIIQDPDGYFIDLYSNLK